MKISKESLGGDLAGAIDRVAANGERVVLTRKRKGVAALVSMDDLAVLQRLEDEADVKAARKALKEKGGVPFTDIKKRLGIVIRSARSLVNCGTEAGLGNRLAQLFGRF